MQRTGIVKEFGWGKLHAGAGLVLEGAFQRGSAVWRRIIEKKKPPGKAASAMIHRRRQR